MSGNPQSYRPNVGVMLTNGKGQVLLGLRNDAPDAWQMPQGGIEEGEDVIVAAKRELQEEMGVLPELVEFAGQTSDWLYYDYPETVAEIYRKRHRGQKQLWVHFTFKGTDADIDVNTVEPEFTAFKWADPAEAVSLIVAFKRRIYEYAFKELLG